MLQYLVTSKVRRRLLMLLWTERKAGSVAELADLARVAFASAHTELKAMQRAQLVVSERVGGKEVFAANNDHPGASTLRALVAGTSGLPPTSAADELLRRELVSLGAPLRGVEPAEVVASKWMATLVRGAALARRDAVVARALPLCFWRLRDSLDLQALQAEAVAPEDKHAVGFFLELTGELGGDRRLVGLAESFRDRRLTSVRDFFHQSPARRETFREFPLAARWGFRMNTDAESFRSLFEKFVKRIETRPRYRGKGGPTPRAAPQSASTSILRARGRTR